MSSLTQNCDGNYLAKLNIIPVIDHSVVSQAQAAQPETAPPPPPTQRPTLKTKPKTNLKTVRRIPKPVSKTLLPTVINLNPRSLYGRLKELKILIQEYKGDLVCVSESWNRENLPLNQIVDIPGFKVFENCKQRDKRGGKPMIIANTDKYVVRQLCPSLFTVPASVEAVWVLVRAKTDSSHRREVKNIIVCSYYFSTTITKADILLDHLAQSYNILRSKYGPDAHYILCADSNHLDLSQIIRLSPDFKQVVNVPTRLNPPAVLDTIITSLAHYYESPVAKPPIESDSQSGKPSDHLVVVWRPLYQHINENRRKYRSVSHRPLTERGICEYGRWLISHDWNQIYQMQSIDDKVETFHNILMQNYFEIFPLKKIKVSSDDKPWYTSELKKIDRLKKREFDKHHKSAKWKQLQETYKKLLVNEKEKYYKNIVQDLKTSDPRKWYAKVKRMTGKDEIKGSVNVEEIEILSEIEQANKISEFYANTRNQFPPVMKSHFPDFYVNSESNDPTSLLILPSKIPQIIKKMNKKAATVEGDLPMKLLVEFANEISLPLTHIINSIFEKKTYPKMWKHEIITPVPKIYPPSSIQQLRPISGLMNCAKIMDKLLAEYMISDMGDRFDKQQYGNEKGMSLNHLLIDMLHKIHSGLDKNSANNKMAAILTMVDWSQAFERQNHKLGIQSFIDNGVRPSLIPVLISFFQERNISVKWKGVFSKHIEVTGGGPQGGTAGGILEYLSQSAGNLSFLNEDEGFKFIDDASMVEIVNLFLAGLASINPKVQVPSDISAENLFLPQTNFATQSHLNAIDECRIQRDETE